MRNWIKKLEAESIARGEAEQRRRERAAKPPSVRGFDYGVRARRLQARIDYIHHVWLDHLQRTAAQRLRQQRLNSRTYFPPAPQPHELRLSMDELVPIFNLTPQSLGPALRAAGWRQIKPRGGARRWAPPHPSFIPLSSPRIRAAAEAEIKERKDQSSVWGRALNAVARTKG